MTTISDDYPQDSSTQGRIEVGHSTNGSIESANDVDWFKVHLDAGQSYSISSDSTNVVLGLYSAKGELTWSGYGVAQLKKPMILSYTAQYSGDYFVGVRGGSTTGSYSVGVASSAPNDYSWPGSGVLKPGAIVHGSLASFNESDSFAMDVQRGKLYQLTLHLADPSASVENFYSTMVVGGYDQSFQAVKEGDNLVLRFEAGSTGKMFVRLGASMAAGSYELRAESIADDFGADATAAGSLAAGESIGGTFGARGDSDWFKIHLSADKAYAFTLSGASVTSSNSSIAVYDADGNRVATPGSGSMWTPATDGDYYIDVSSRPDVYTVYPALGAYTLATSVVGSDPGYTGAIPVLASQIGSEVSSVLELAGDEDPISFIGASNTWYTFTMAQPGLSLDLDAFGPDGEYVGTYYTGKGYAFKTDAAGNYLLRVSGSAANSYTLKVEDAAPDDVGDNRPQALSLKTGESFGGRIDNRFDQDMFKIALKGGETYQLDLGASAAVAAVTDGDGKTIASGLASSGRFTVRDSGEYFVAVTGQQVAAYQFKVLASADAAPGNTGTSATLAVNGVVNGAFDGVGDIDWYSVALQGGKQYVFEVKYPSFVLQPPLQLLDAAGHSVPADIASAGGDKYLVRYSPHETGNFFLSIGATYGAGTYSVTATELVPDDHASELANGTLLLPGELRNATLSFDTDSDAFQLQLQADHRYTLEVRKAGAPAPVTYINFIQLDGATASMGLPGQWAQSVAKDGMYGFRVDKALLSGVGDYSVRLVDWGLDDYGDSAPVATRVGAGRHDGVLTTDSDTDVMIAHLAKGIYELQLDASASSTSTVSVQITGQSVNIPVVSTTTGGKLTFAALEEGDFKFAISGSGVGFGSVAYSLTLAGAGVASPPGDGNDTIAGAVDGSILNGFGGVDTVVYGAARSAYVVARAGDGFKVSAHGQSDTLLNIERVVFGYGEGLALDVDGAGGQLYRLYQSAFNRAPDLEGLGWWLAAVDRGTSIYDVAKEFVVSGEFRAAYGENLSDADFVTQLYRNTLHREPDAEGRDYWLGELAHGQTRANVLIGFSESVESQQLVAPAIADGFAYIPFL